jgi:hypothetical protein
VAHLQPLLAFLGHQPYGMHRNIWEVGPLLLHFTAFLTACSSQGVGDFMCVQDAVQRPFEAHQIDGRMRLVDLLRHTTIRASKDDLITMTKCFRKVCLHLEPGGTNKGWPSYIRPRCAQQFWLY